MIHIIPMIASAGAAALATAAALSLGQRPAPRRLVEDRETQPRDILREIECLTRRDDER